MVLQKNPSVATGTCAVLINGGERSLVANLAAANTFTAAHLDTEDAKDAVRFGADGIIVSNHGGRQLDGAISPLRALPGVVAEAGAMPVMMDSGVRRGGDVLKALALGARFVFVGRPFNYAAAVGGQAGVAHAIGLLRAEVDRNMAMLGINRLEEMNAGLLAPA